MTNSVCASCINNQIQTIPTHEQSFKDVVVVNEKGDIYIRIPTNKIEEVLTLLNKQKSSSTIGWKTKVAFGLVTLYSAYRVLEALASMHEQLPLLMIESGNNTALIPTAYVFQDPGLFDSATCMANKTIQFVQDAVQRPEVLTQSYFSKSYEALNAVVIKVSGIVQNITETGCWFLGRFTESPAQITYALTFYELASPTARPAILTLSFMYFMNNFS
ncbi:MAG: hypothetical protein S4CHLAM123_01910 [Chlamydiales bacterium]|nr:hypothetical protein [Chlamydiales bacterium]